MESKHKVEVEIISHEIVKPSTPTPSNLKTFNLSFLDQTFPPCHLNFLLVYTNSTTQTPPDIAPLRLSLIDTLSRFYPFAGRCENESIVCCDDQGIPFITARVNCLISDVFNPSSVFKSFSEFFPPADLTSIRRRPVSELVPLAFQINIFACGGVVIGCNMFHKLMDAASLGTFLNYWSGLSTNKHENLVEPDFNVACVAFPPSPKVDRYTITGMDDTLLELGSSIRVVAKSFLFTKLSLTELKEKATSDQLPHPTRFKALAGFVWKHALDAARDAGSVSRNCSTMLSIAANIRSRTTPPFPKGSIGNFSVTVYAHAEKQTRLTDLATEIHESLSTQVKSRIDDYMCPTGAEAMIEFRNSSGLEMLECSPSFYKLSSLCNLGMNDADFGFGKAERNVIWYHRLYPLLRNFIFFTDYVHPSGNGIEVRLMLEEKEMQILESNPLFLAFALPI